MQRWNTREELEHEVVTLVRQGVPQRAIARAMQISRNTVRSIVTRHAVARTEPQDGLLPKRPAAPRASKLDAHQERVAALLQEFPDITAQRVFEEVRSAGFTGGYTAVKKYVRKVRPRQKAEPSLPTPKWGPGEMAESDWSPYTLTFTTGEQVTVQGFAYVLCHSRRKYYGIHEGTDLHALMDGHVAAFERFGGAAAECKYDIQKPVVLGFEGQQPIYNPRFLAFATYYEFRPRACRPRHPNDKPVVERSFWELEQSFFNGRKFRDRDDLRHQLRGWLDGTCDVRPHKTLRRTALQMFEEERAHLVPLPRYPYDTARVLYRLCTIDGFIHWDGNRYAVPYAHVTDFLPVRITARELSVYAADLTVVARHELAPRSAGVDVDPQGLHRRPSGRPAADAEQLEKAFGALGEEGAAFFAALHAASPRQCGHRAREILLLRERYSTVDLLAALNHARSYGALNHQAIQRILAMKAKPRTLADYVNDQLAKRLSEDGTPSFVNPTDLAVYDEIPLSTSAQVMEHPCPSSDRQPDLPVVQKSLTASDATSKS